MARRERFQSLPDDQHLAVIHIDRTDVRAFTLARSNHPDDHIVALHFDTLKGLQALKIETELLEREWIDRWGDD